MGMSLTECADISHSRANGCAKAEQHGDGRIPRSAGSRAPHFDKLNVLQNGDTFLAHGFRLEGERAH
jgi:hypothetical protein